MSGDSGLVSFNIVALTGDPKFTGITYALARIDGNWEIKYKKEVNTPLTMELRRWVPDINGITKRLMLHNDRHFYGDDREFSGVCSSNDCIGGAPISTESFGASWLWRKSVGTAAITSYPLSAWSDNFAEWWNQAYSVADWNLPGQLSEFWGV